MAFLQGLEEMLEVQVFQNIFVIILFVAGTGRAGILGAITAHHYLAERRTGVRTRGSWWVAERNLKEPEHDDTHVCGLCEDVK